MTLRQRRAILVAVCQTHRSEGLVPLRSLPVLWIGIVPFLMIGCPAGIES
jgi:hypothetical protein